MTDLPAVSNDRVDLLEGDIRTLAKLVFAHRKPLSEGDIRAASAILRRWICEGLIGQLGNETGATISFPVFDNAKVFEALPIAGDVNYFLTGGVMFNGLPLMGFYNSAAPPSEAPSLPLAPFPEIVLPFGRFKRQKRVWFEGEAFSCEEIITFVANKLGGVHYDDRRDHRQEKMERAATYITFGGPAERLSKQPPGAMHFEVEPQSNEALSGFHVEVVAAAASFIGMHVDGEALVKFDRRSTVLGRLAGLFRRRSRIRLIELKTGEL